MYAGEVAVKRVHRIIKPRRCELYKDWLCPLLFLKKHYYLNIYFNSQFYITEIQTNHRRLKVLYKQDRVPKTLYRIVDANFHASLLVLFHHLKYVAPNKSFRIQFQLNKSNISSYGRLKVLVADSSYCLKLKICAIRNASKLLDTYQHLPIYTKEIAYRLYADIHQISFQDPTKIASLLQTYPHSQTSLYDAFQKVIGVNPSIVWRDRRLINFARYLLQTEDAITDIYADFGFSNPSHLYKYFKAHFNTTPIAFREKYKK